MYLHLEVTSDLSSQSFLAAFSRFIARRGCPSCMYSDNGKNFAGAAELFRKDRLQFLKTLQTQTLQQYSHNNLVWKFIPPGATTWAVCGKRGMSFTFEELSTILARIEAYLNFRPLHKASDNPNDFSPLISGHFLIGTSMLAPAEPDISGQDVTLANRWQRLKIISQYFCMRWKSEYLNDLHRRTKRKYQ
ncbi:uncharacterized protein LOC142239833 [Haematobia irritans]|uniref:uncharacterized protein LOC142239833 n=1 Tax=Haematobia irritans TaxID=7368 RepID=UPI003F500734